jgi:hypothetical protein
MAQALEMLDNLTYVFKIKPRATSGNVALVTGR